MRYEDDDNLANINCSFNSRDFLKYIKQMNYYFNERYVDYVRIPYNYIVISFGKFVTSQLVQVVSENILECYGSICGNIYLPFYPHMFSTLNPDSDLTELFCLSYILTRNMTKYNHKVLFATNTITEENKCLGL